MKGFRIFGDPGGIRTHGLSLRRRPLYPAELRNHNVFNDLRWGDPSCLPAGLQEQNQTNEIIMTAAAFVN